MLVRHALEMQQAGIGDSLNRHNGRQHTKPVTEGVGVGCLAQKAAAAPETAERPLLHPMPANPLSPLPSRHATWRMLTAPAVTTNSYIPPKSRAYR
jgi:hypothetical protein